MLGKSYLLLAIILGGGVFFGATENSHRIADGRHARIASVVSALSAQTMKGAGEFTAEQCAECHEDEVASFDNTTHARAWHSDSLACSTCHGDATEHMKAGGGKGTMRSVKTMSPSEASDLCLSCHEQPGEQSHMRLSEHMLAGVACTDCHDVHPSNEAKMERVGNGNSAMMRAPQSELCVSCHKKIDAEFSLPTHHRMKEGLVECTSCHNPHGTTEEKQLRADSKENCLKCHEDKRGPFTYEHDAAEIEGCLSCHQPHGSSGPHLLKARDERTLCISCHSIETGVGVPHSRLGLQATGDCTRCHSEIHGSHSSPFFTQ